MIVYRPASVAESDDVARLFRLTRERSMPYLPALHGPDDDRRFFRERVFAQCDIVVAVRATAIVGSCASRPGWIDHLYVHPDHQGGGIGSELLRLATSAAEVVRLWVFQRNERAIRFYRSKGFALVETTDGSTNEEREPDALYASSRRSG